MTTPPRLLTAAILASAPFLSAPAGAQLAFDPHITILRGDADDLTVGDTNDDGFGDVIVAESTPDFLRWVIVLAGDGSGELTRIWDEQLQLGNYPATTVDLAPVAGPDDGPLDLVFHNVTPRFRLGAGDGTFERGKGAFIESGDVHDAVVGEFDGDGEVDTAILLQDWWPLICFASGNGDGTFGITWIADDNWSADADLEMARLNDGDLADAVVADGFGLRVLLEPDDHGPKLTLTTLQASDLALADIDGDGDLDPLATLPSAGAVGVSLNQGDGAFAPLATWPAGDSPSDVAVADLDADGFLDVAVTDPAAAAVRILLGQGDGSLVLQHPLPLADAEGQLASVDVTGDGMMDLVLAHSSVGAVTTLVNSAGR